MSVKRSRVEIEFSGRVTFRGAPLEVYVSATVYLGNYFAEDDPDMVEEIAVFLLDTDKDITDQLLEDDVINLEIEAMKRARERNEGYDSDV